MSDLTIDPFAPFSFGRIALRKLGNVDPDFRLYKAGWLGNSNEYAVMAVTGARFRKAMRGPNKGQLSVRVPNTTRTTYVTAEEIREYEKEHTVNGQLR